MKYDRIRGYVPVPKSENEKPDMESVKEKDDRRFLRPPDEWTSLQQDRDRRVNLHGIFRDCAVIGPNTYPTLLGLL